ncbi:MAG: COG4280 domain-containing protein [Solirubrobacteraceae bacterium]
MSGTEVGLVASVFIACTVEAVEALTIVLAVAATRSWRSAMLGVGAALLALAAVVAALGPALTALPLSVLRVAVGGLLLIFGLQWLRKAILRAGGVKAVRDENAAFLKESRAALDAGVASGEFDGYSFFVAFKGSFLEGLEVVFIVLTFGANQRDVPLAAAAAAAAVLVVVGIGALVRAPLARVPENTLKFVVGVMLTSFGLFWSVEGAGGHWPGSETALLAVVPSMALFALGTVAVLRRWLARSAAEAVRA